MTKIVLVALVLFASSDSGTFHPRPGGTQHGLQGGKTFKPDYPHSLSPGPLVPANPSFDTAITATLDQAEGTWWYGTQSAGGGGSNSVTAPFASAEMTGANVAKLYVSAISSGYANQAHIHYRFNKTTINATTQVVTFDFRLKNKAGVPSGLIMYLSPYDAGNVYLSDAAHAYGGYMLYDSSSTFAGTTYPMLAGCPNPASLNTNYTATFNLKTLATNALKAGKAWADVSYVVMEFYARTDTNASGGIVNVYIDNFR